jgi:aromatic-L-amino-acid decarboxylase
MTRDDDPADLDHSPEELRRMTQAVVSRVLAHQASIEGAPACGDVEALELFRSLREGPPERGTPIEELLGPLFDDLVPRSFNTTSGGYLAYVPGGGLYEAALADLIADATNRYTGVWVAAPGLAQLEANVVDWLCGWMSYPGTARGILTSGGSFASLSAVVCAREAILGSRLRDGTMYVSTQTHHCVAKAARIAGVLPDRVREIAVDASFRMRVDALAEAIAADRREGAVPFLVVSSAGTTNTGAVDPLDAIADLCEQEARAGSRLWHHVDGAYGACFHLVPELRPLLAGLPRADSITLDPHKGLFLPYGTGALLVRDGDALRAAHAATASYMPAGADPAEWYDTSQLGPELSRPFRGLRVWLALKVHGAARFRAALAEKRQLALLAAEELGRTPGIAVDASPQLSLVAFHAARPGADQARQDADTRELLRRVNARRRVFLSGCQTEGRFLCRICVLSFRTREAHVRAAIEDVAAAAAEIMGERG